MGTIAEKLSYLNDTKDLFKDRLNSLGAEITSSTTFRNYLNWLDTFYGEVSDKTDLSQNGVVGRTSQESTTGANVMPVANVTKTTGGIEITNNGDGTLTLNGTATAQIIYPITNTGNSILRRVPVTENDYKFMLYGDTNVSNDTYFLQVLFGLDSETTKLFNATDNGATSLHIATDRSIGYALIIRKGQSFNNHIIKPMGVLSTYTGGFEPFTNGASPNPDYPQPINNLSGDVAYKVSGKNLFNVIDFENGLVSGKIKNDDGIEVSDNTSQYSTYFIPVIANQPYYFDGYFQRIYLYNSNKEWVGRVIGSSSISRMNTSYTPTINGYIQIQIHTSTYNSNKGTEIISLGSTATTYESYISQTFDIPLGDIELCKIGTYQDRIYKQNGKWYLEKNIGKVIFNGTEKWIRSGNTSDNFFCGALAGVNVPFEAKIGASNDSKTNYFVKGNKYSNAEVFDMYNGTDYYTTFALYLSTSRATDITTFKNWLSTHNTELCYVLATPTTTEITASNYPELYAALKEIQDYLTSYKINKEFILGYSSPEIEY